MTPHRPTTTARRRMASAVAVWVVVSLAACGGGAGDGGSRDAASPGTSAPGNADPTAASPVETDAVDIKEFNYAPQIAKVEVGRSVTWTNRDSFAHTVTAKDRSYDSGSLAEGKTFTRTYDRPGTYDYFCAIHNSMIGSVVVE